MHDAYSNGQVNFSAVKGSAALNKYIIYADNNQVTSGDVVEGENHVPVTIPGGTKKIRVQVTDVNGESSSVEKEI